MSNQHNNQRPRWVQWAVWGIENRTVVWMMFWVTAALPVAWVIWGFTERRFFAGIALFGAALWYVLAIKWMDAHDQW